MVAALGGGQSAQLNGKILVFARTPRRGAVKTRLQTLLGEDGCYQLHKKLVAITVKTAVDTEIAPVEIWHTGESELPFWREQTRGRSLVLNQQKGDDLGERMHAACNHVLGSAGWVILIGSDCPEIDSEYLRQAAHLLDKGKPVVIGPARDGGYVLIGLQHPYKFLFENISWGTSSVLAETLAHASENKCPVHLMNTLRDLDVEEDLLYYRAVLNIF